MKEESERKGTGGKERQREREGWEKREGVGR